MIKCSHCGADNRDTARFCKICGGKLLLPVAQPLPTWAQPLSTPGIPSAAGQLQGPGVAPFAPLHQAPPGMPAGFPRVWKDPQPNVEGRVAHAEAPVQERGAIGGKVVLAGILAFITPILAFLPFAGGTQIAVRYMRVEDWQTGQQRSVKMRGEPQGNINIGDWVAVWGKEEGGNIIMRVAHNYTTDARIGIKT